MYTLSQIRRRVDALKRKYAAELTVIKLYPLAEDFCLLWTCAVADGNPVPDTHAFIRTIARNGVRLDTFTLLVPYLERCRNEEREPDSFGIISILLPQVPCERTPRIAPLAGPHPRRAGRPAGHPGARPHPGPRSPLLDRPHPAGHPKLRPPLHPESDPSLGYRKSLVFIPDSPSQFNINSI